MAKTRIVLNRAGVRALLHSQAMMEVCEKHARDAQARLDLMCSTEDGFEIAEQDMRMRGPGDIEGTQQSGLPVNLHIASLARDGVLLSEAREYAARVLSDDPELSGSANRLLAQQLRRGRYEIHDFSKIS